MSEASYFETVTSEEASLDFRQILRAMAYPGKPQQCLTLPTTTELHTMTRSMQQILTALVNREVTVAFFGITPAEPCRKWLTYHLHTTIVDETSADFVITDASNLTAELITRIKHGTEEFPDRSATLLVNWNQSFEQPTNQPLLATGPGINPNEPDLRLSLDALCPSFIEARKELQSRYPLGVDAFLCAEKSFMALPRTTRLTRQGAK